MLRKALLGVDITRWIHAAGDDRGGPWGTASALLLLALLLRASRLFRTRQGA